MQRSTDTRPRLAIMIGDPAGIGPEVVAKALAQVGTAAPARLLLVGSCHALQRACESAGLDLPLHAVRHPEEAAFSASRFDVLDEGQLPPEDFAFGQASAAAGRAVAAWIARCRALVASGWAAGWIAGPIDRVALRLGTGLAEAGEALEDSTPLLRISGPLRIVPMSEHIPLRDVSASLTQQAVLDRLLMVVRVLRAWGMEHPRLGVAGLNPHARGVEEQEVIAPAVAQAQALGLTVEGPVSPDAVFRQCIEGRHDLVLSMYHDQGQIALKTAAFEGACSFYVGLPHVQATVPHGSAFDIAGRGIADARAMQGAILGAALQAAGVFSLRAFPEERTAP